MIEKLSSLPLYQHINMALLFGGLLLCIICWLLGVGVRVIKSRRLTCPPRYEGSRFPNIADELCIIFYLLIFTAMKMGEFFTDEPNTGENPNLTAGAWLSSIYTLLIASPFILRYLTLPPTKGILSKLNFKRLGLCLLSIYLAAALMDLAGLDDFIMSKFGAPENQSVVDMMAEGDSSSLLLALGFSAIIVAPITEEITFRGFLYNVLRQRCGIIISTLVSSLFFSVIHVSLVQEPALFLFGCLQCYLFEKTNSIVIPIIFHMCFNALSVCFIINFM